MMSATLKANLTTYMWSWTLLTCLLLSGVSAEAWGHGGVPRVLSVHRGEGTLRVLDTLGIFEAPLSEGVSAPNPSIERMSWRWLCDDAVDMMAGVDAAVRLGERVILAVSRSGVYRSEDGGCTFDPLGPPLSLHTVPHLSAHPTEVDEVAVASHTLGQANDVFVSQDGGRTWRPAGLNVTGGIYALWRNPDAPHELWVSHAEGLSISRDGGGSFTADPLQTQAGLTLTEAESASLVTRPQALKLMGGGEVTTGPLAGQQVRWMSVNLYPDSTLMRQVGDGPWVPVHQVADSYESLTFTGETVLVSTTFSGVFRRRVEEGASAWSNDEGLPLGCLHAWRGEVWACGRGDRKPWLVGVSLDQGESWRAVWGAYSEAAGASWGCPEGSLSVEACSARCLDESCELSGLVGGAMSMGGGASDGGASDGGVSDGGSLSAEPEMTPTPSSQGGCDQRRPQPPVRELLLLLSLMSLSRAWRRSRA